MVEAQQFMMEPTDKVTAPRSSPASGIKTILLQVVDNEQLPHALETGLALARACSAHLSCLHVAPIEAYVAFDGFGMRVLYQDLHRVDPVLSLRPRRSPRLARCWCSSSC